MRLFATLMLALAPLCAQAQEVEIQFDGVEMAAFLQWSSALTSNRIVYEDKGLAAKKVYILSPRPLPVKEVWSLTRSVLSLHGFGLTRMGESNDYKVVALNMLSKQPAPVVDRPDRKTRDERYVTHVVELQHVTAKAVLSALKAGKLLSDGRTSAIEVGARHLMLSDLEPHLAKIVEVVETIDRPGPKVTSRFFSLREERAEQMVSVLTKLLGGDRRRRADSVVLEAHARTNMVIARGTAAQLAVVAEHIAQLDRKSAPRLDVRYRLLRHGNAKDIAALMGGVVKQPPFSADKDDPIGVVADERANALVLTAHPDKQLLLERLVAQLDRPRAQVLLEVAIVEFTPTDAVSLGIELATLDNAAIDKTRGLAHSAFGLSSLVEQAGSVIPAGAPGLPSSSLPISGIGLNAFLVKGLGARLPFVLRALQTRNHTNVLSLPRILAVDGVSAELRVTDETPVVQTNALNTATSTTSFQQFVPAGTILKFTPRIGARKTIGLEIEQTVEAFVGASPGPGVPPAKTSRKLTTTVRVPDGRIAILGGFAVAREVETVEQIPLLGDIPLLGFLFRSTVKSVSKTHLYIFVQPRIIPAGDTGALRRASKAIEQERTRRVPAVDLETRR